MSKVKVIILILAVFLVFSGVAYASWTEQVQLDVVAKTAKCGAEYYGRSH